MYLIGYGLDVWDLVSVRGRDSSLHCCILTGSLAHPFCYPMNPEGKVAEA